MSAVLNLEMRNAGRPRQLVGCNTAYAALYPEAIQSWYDLIHTKQVTKELRDEVHAMRDQMCAKQKVLIAEWDAANPELAAQYYKLKEEHRLRRQERIWCRQEQLSNAKKRSATDDDGIGEKMMHLKI